MQTPIDLAEDAHRAHVLLTSLVAYVQAQPTQAIELTEADFTTALESLETLHLYSVPCKLAGKIVVTTRRAYAEALADLAGEGIRAQ